MFQIQNGRHKEAQNCRQNVFFPTKWLIEKLEQH